MLHCCLTCFPLHTEMNDLVSFNRAALSDRWIFQTKPASCGGGLSINEGPLQARAFLLRPERGRISPSAINKWTLWCGLYERTGGRLMEGIHLLGCRHCLASPTIAWQLPTWPLIVRLRQRGCWSSQWRSHTSLCLDSYSCCSRPQAIKVGRSIGSRPGLCS